MDERRMRRWLWGALLLLAPLPSLGLQTAWIPVARQWVLVGVTALFLVLESTGGVAPLILVLLGLQALAGTGVAWLGAWALVRGARHLSAGRRGAALAALVLLLAGVAVAAPIYRTPYSPVAVHATLWEVYR